MNREEPVMPEVPEKAAIKPLNGIVMASFVAIVVFAVGMVVVVASLKAPDPEKLRTESLAQFRAEFQANKDKAFNAHHQACLVSTTPARVLNEAFTEQFVQQGRSEEEARIMGEAKCQALLEVINSATPQEVWRWKKEREQMAANP